MHERRTVADHPLIELTRARVLEFVRDPAAIFWVFGFPIILAIALGIAFREAPQQAWAVGWVQLGGEIAPLQADERLSVEVMKKGAALEALARGKLDLVMLTDASGSGPARVTFRFDPAQPQSHAARLAVDAALQRALGRSDVISVSEEIVVEPGQRYIDFLMPGLIALNLLGSSMWGIGYAVVDTRKRKLLKRFAVTPMRRSDFLLSYMFSRMIFLAAEVLVLVAFGWLAFDVAVQGSLIAYAGVCLLGATSFTGMAMMVAARPTSTEVASGWLNFVMMPMWLLSGTFFSYARFPEFLHPVIRALPLTALNDALRALTNQGESIFALGTEVAVLSAWGIIGFAIALKTFRWQ